MRKLTTMLVTLLLLISNEKVYSQYNSRKKIGIGTTIGYKSEFNTVGIFLDYEPIKNTKIVVGGAFSNKLPFGYTLGIKRFMKIIRNDSNLLVYLGLSYSGIKKQKYSIESEKITSNYIFSKSSYIIPNMGIGIRTFDRTPATLYGAELILYLDYRIRNFGSNLEFISGNGNRDFRQEERVNNMARGGFGFGISVIVHLKFTKEII